MASASAKPLFHIADFAFDLYENIVLGLLDAGFGTRDLMKDRRSGTHGFLGIEDGGKHFIINFDQAAALPPPRLQSRRPLQRGAAQ